MMELFDKDRQGMVLRIERSSVYDGEGFRTVVFLKGCPLRCQWCSTPESQSFEIERTADNVYGTVMTVEDVVRELRKDSLFFFISTGGITVSGGEPLAQPEFTLALLKNSRMECMNTAIETSFFAPWERVCMILPHVNTVFVDLKLFSNDLHKRYCGTDNDLILQNLLKTNEAEGSFRLVVRRPIIPGINDSREELDKMGEFCARLRRLDHVQLLPYHRLGAETYKKLGRPYPLEALQIPAPEHMLWCREEVRHFVDQVL
ncbi:MULTISPECIES: glycyl-radical enzyme activating protein [Acutalibacteraceae]|uniref:glycyl-radical enzyme activating protein n=1 Tax=Acutalibacteraceae TaxID=3082771 RepID=UPI001FAAE8EE|nr:MULTISPECIES: glycyl-radical enzyme activating protein [Acutalibacteraceae]